MARRFQVGARVQLTEKYRAARVKQFSKDYYPGPGTVMAVNGRNTHKVRFDQLLWQFEADPEEDEWRGPDWRHMADLPGSALEAAPNE